MTKLANSSGKQVDTEWTFEQLADIKLPLVKAFYKTARYSPKVNKQDEVYVLRSSPEGEIVAAVRLTTEQDTLLLRSMVVLPAMRSKGIGKLFLRRLTESIGARDCWCFPFEHLESFYQSAQFACIEPTEAPPNLQQKYHRYCSHGKRLLIMKRSR